jgi:Sulfotransferase family.
MKMRQKRFPFLPILALNIVVLALFVTLESSRWSNKDRTGTPSSPRGIVDNIVVHEQQVSCPPVPQPPQQQQQQEERHTDEVVPIAAVVPKINVLIPHFHNEHWLVAATTALIKRAANPGTISIQVYDMGSDLNLREILPASVNIKPFASDGVGGSALPPFFQDSLSESDSEITVLCDSDSIILYQGWDEALIEIFHNSSFVAAGISPRGNDSGPHIISSYHAAAGSSQDCFDHSLEWNWLAVRSSFYKSRAKQLLSDYQNEKYCDWGSWFVHKATQDGKLALRFMKVDMTVVENKSPRVVQHPDGRLWAVHMFYGSRGRLDLAPDSPERRYILTEEEAEHLRKWALWDGSPSSLKDDNQGNTKDDSKFFRPPRNITLAQLQPSYLTQIHTAYCEEHKLLVCSPAKSASSESLRWISRICNLNINKNPYTDSRIPIVYNQMQDGVVTQKVLDWFQKWTIVTVARDPWARVVSGFYDKFSELPLHQNPWACEVAQQMRSPFSSTSSLNCSSNNTEASHPLEFHEFLDYVTSTPDATDRFEHFSTQESACPQWLRPDFVARHESLEDDFKHISQVLGINVKHVRPANSGSMNTTLEHVKKHFLQNCTNVERVRKRYLVDVERFGYTPPDCLAAS